MFGRAKVRCDFDNMGHKEVCDPDLLRNSRGGLLQHLTKDGVEYSLVFEPAPGRGMSLHLHIYCKSDFSKNCGWCSDDGSGNAVDTDWVLLNDGATVPSGSFVGWDVAAKAASEFLDNPISLPGAVQWVDTDTLNWPETDY